MDDIPFIVPVGMKYRATARGCAPKFVKCEECALEYVYLYEGKGKAEASSAFFLDNAGASERAKAEAEKRLAGDLEHGSAVVPCPRCGRIQDYMIPQARAAQHGWMAFGAVLCFIGAAIAALPACIITAVTSGTDEATQGVLLILGVFGLVALGAILLTLRYARCKRYDPNTEPVGMRIQIGREAAFTKEDFLKMTAASEGETG